MHDIAKHVTMSNNMPCIGEWVRDVNTCPWLVGMHDFEWVWGDIIVDWGTGTRQSESRTGIFSRARTPTQIKREKNHGLLWGGNDGQGIQARTHRTGFQGYDAEIEKKQKRQREKREQSIHVGKVKLGEHICKNVHVQHLNFG